MEVNSIQSSFRSLPIQSYVYPSPTPSNKTVLLLKGIYGWHDPQESSSWENQLVASAGHFYNFICINTSRDTALGFKKTKEAFEGKTFTQECEDIIAAYNYLKTNTIFLSDSTLIILANSFGGTLLLNMPSLLEAAKATIMIGSGCGRSPETKKPLLATMPDEASLLKNLCSYNGIFGFVRGSNDTVVPAVSQQKIIDAAKNARIRMTHTVLNANHDLSFNEGHSEIDRTHLLSSLLQHAFEL